MADLRKETLALKRWAVVGAREDTATYGYRIFRHLRDRDYVVMPVNPKLSEIDGVPCHASIADLPETPDVVDMVVNPSIGIGVMEQIRARGIKYVWLQPGTRSDEIRDFAKQHGIELVEDCVLVRLP